MKLKSLTNVIIIVILSLLISCSFDKDQKLWDQSVEKNTIEAYEVYIKDFPDGKFVQNANDKIQELYFKNAESDISEVWSIYDKYISEYPEGSYKDLFETIIYNQAILENTINAFEGYITRFPNGLYIKEFETIIYENIKQGESDMSFEDYMVSFPKNEFIPEIDSIIYASLEETPGEEGLRNYKILFPEGKYIYEVNSLLETMAYDKILKDINVSLISQFISDFPGSAHIKRLKFTSNPDKVNVFISDSINDTIATITTPATIKMIDGVDIHINYSKDKYKPVSKTYFVGSNGTQIINENLELILDYVHVDNFDEAGSLWESNQTNKSFVVNSNGYLECKVKDIQYQVLKSLEIDLNKNFKFDVSFKFVNNPNRNTSHFGFLWGSKNSPKYFFISQEGRFGFGEVKYDNRSVENIYGYSNWESKQEGSRWMQASGFSTNGFNILVVERIGNKYKYSINGNKLITDVINKTTTGNMVGLGLGNTTVEIDYIKISK